MSKREEIIFQEFQNKMKNFKSSFKSSNIFVFYFKSVKHYKAPLPRAVGHRIFALFILYLYVFIKILFNSIFVDFTKI